jgi:acyl-CoA dehydrogenase
VEELAAACPSTAAFITIHNMVTWMVASFGFDDLKQDVVPKLASGEWLASYCLTEPGAGSDLQGIKTTAVKDASGEHYLLNGSKTFITNGQMADLVIVVAKTDPKEGAKGISLFMVEAAWEGFEKGQNLNKVGMKAQDTSELFFQDVKLPADKLLGAMEGQGFFQLMQELPAERLQVGLTAVAAAEAAWQWTLDYVKDRKAFGKPVIKFQNTRFKLAELKAEITAARVFCDRCLELHLEKKLDIPTAAMLKQYTTDLQCKVMDECVQLHGGYGYMWEYPIARAWADSRVQRIYAGTNEIMKEIVARSF